MFEKLGVALIGVAGLAAAFVEANKHIVSFWDAMEIKDDEDWNNYVKSFRYEPPGQVQIVNDRYEITVSDFFQISDLYDRLNKLSVYTRGTKPNEDAKSILVRLIKADGDILEFTFTDAGWVAEDNLIYPVLSYRRFEEFLEGMHDDSDL